MITPILMRVPAALLAAVEGGSAQVIGAVVKNVATGQVLGHLQPTLAFTQMAASMSPLGMAVTAVANLGMQAAQMQKLAHIEDMLESLKIVSTAGAAASVVNLAVCVGGFALVLTALKKTDAKVDALSAAVERLGQRDDARLVAAVRVALERAEDAFGLPLDEARERWLRCDEQLHQLSTLLVELLAKSGLPLESSPGGKPLSPDDAARRLAEPEVAQLLEFLLNVQRAHVETLICLGRPALAAKAASRAHGWFSRLPSDRRVIAMARTGGRPLSGPQIERITSEAGLLGQWISTALLSSEQQAQICGRLEADKVDCLQYVQEVRSAKEPALLYYACASS